MYDQTIEFWESHLSSNQASNWASKKSREFKAYVRREGEFGDVGFQSQGKKKTEVGGFIIDEIYQENGWCCFYLLFFGICKSLQFVCM